MVGVQRTVYGVYGRCAVLYGRCTEGTQLSVILICSFGIRRLVSGWRLTQRCGSPWPCRPGYHHISGTSPSATASDAAVLLGEDGSCSAVMVQDWLLIRRSLPYGTLPDGPVPYYVVREVPDRSSATPQTYYIIYIRYT